MSEGYVKPVTCSACWRSTRAASGVCDKCRTGEGPPPGVATVDELALWVEMQERVMRDLGLNPQRTPSAVVDEVLKAEKIPDRFQFVRMLRAGQIAVRPVDPAPPPPPSPTEVRLTAYWFGLPAGSVGVSGERREQDGVTLVRVQVTGRRVWVPVEFTESLR